LTNTPWIINNPDNLISWKPDTCSGLPNSEKSLFMDYFYYEPELGQIDDLISPLLNMPDTGGVELTYDIAYRQRRSWTDDSLKVYVSTDCGASFPYLLFANGGNSLETFPYNLGTVRFYPETADHWRKDTIDLSQFTGIGQIMLKFAGINDRGNSLWLDNIEIKGKPGVVRIDKISTTAFNIFPNPASNRLYIVFDKKPIHDSKISIHNIDGKLIEHFSGQKQNINIAINNYADGIYFVRLRSVDGVKVKRFSVVK
ncbi:MAG: T9SS type A sorting domain-containing protein, partial [Bacteroidota bacterium]|nr:T9SS type A sorting domain-containing protein [Bacteroidota bacterium]